MYFSRRSSTAPPRHSPTPPCKTLQILHCFPGFMQTGAGARPGPVWSRSASSSLSKEDPAGLGGRGGGAQTEDVAMDTTSLTLVQRPETPFGSHLWFVAALHISLCGGTAASASTSCFFLFCFRRLLQNKHNQDRCLKVGERHVRAGFVLCVSVR